MTLLNGMVGEETYLQGKYLAVGLSSSGTIGTAKNVPSSVTTDTGAGYRRLGLIGDTDGFGTGKAATHDAVVRGLCIEGFNIGYKTGGNTYVRSNQELAGLSQIDGKASNGSTKTVAESDWKGATTEKLGVDQKITLTDDAKFLRFEVTLTNNSSVSMADLRYMRTVDPDLADGFSTVNTIVKQGSGSALVTAAAKAGADPMFLYSNDDRAVVTTGGFINQNPYANSVTTAQAVGTVTNADVSMSINFDLGTLGAGKATTVVFYMGITDNLNATIAQIDKLSGGTVTTPPPVTNTAPVAVDDTLAIVSGDTGKGNVLTNDKDADGDALTAALKKGPSHGTVTLSADGSYVYKAAAGYVGSDSFTYTASDGKASSSATVAVSVKAPPPVNPGLPESPLLQRAGTVDGSASTSDTLTGAKAHNSFYFDLDAKSGADKISNFGEHDILVTNGKLFDGNGDGIISMPRQKLCLDGAGSADTVTIAGVTALRFLGTDDTGLSVYADASVKPKGAIEGKISDDVLKGDVLDAKKNVFFFDTGLDIHLGDDRIDSFGAKDLLVTTSALSSTELGKSGVAKLTGDVGTVELHGLAGAAVQSLEFDGSVDHGGVTYYVYSLEGSAVGTANLSF
ncbi:VCBS repeat-containing protein [Sphingomonas gellani]|uniref:VCBS repeat-containing protein n=1 Tax=Sphingomonas gellani TaxID=1166340 RepID=A0A1H8HVR3_9SPHN|nr:Ig-like domain-containing protein [Sphingomonas gellani]SEN60131.1 VCBS repeat-containing protein [Sphingomonas gellani]